MSFGFQKYAQNKSSTLEKNIKPKSVDGSSKKKNRKLANIGYHHPSIYNMLPSTPLNSHQFCNMHKLPRWSFLWLSLKFHHFIVYVEHFNFFIARDLRYKCMLCLLIMLKFNLRMEGREFKFKIYIPWFNKLITSINDDFKKWSNDSDFKDFLKDFKWFENDNRKGQQHEYLVNLKGYHEIEASRVNKYKYESCIRSHGSFSQLAIG